MSSRPTAAPLRLEHPVRGRWLAQNSPADRVPSHGTGRFAMDHAIDLVPVEERGRSAPFRLRSLLRPEPAESFVGFGREVLAPASGIVESVHDGAEDHPAHRGLPSIGYALTQSRRASAGWRTLAGNHVLLRLTDRGDVVFVALCHLQQGSIAVRPGQEVRSGDRLAACGNSGNSTEPHLHLQAMTTADPTTARAVSFTLPGGLPRSGTIVEGR